MKINKKGYVINYYFLFKKNYKANVYVFLYRKLKFNFYAESTQIRSLELKISC